MCVEMKMIVKNDTSFLRGADGLNDNTEFLKN